MDPIELLRYAAPVAIAALGETVVQRAGLIHISLEGTMLTGAFFAMWVVALTGSVGLGLGAALLIGAAMAIVFGWFTIWRAADQVVVGTALNLLAIGLTGTLFRSQFGQSGKLLSVGKLPTFWGGLDLVLVLLLVSVPIIGFLLAKSSWGLALRSAGEYPKATEAAGYSVLRLRTGAMLIGGMLGGLAGAYLTVGITGSFADNCTAGRGFVAIAMVTFGRWRPWGVLLAALFIGAADSLQFRFQASGVQVPYPLIMAMPYVLTLLVLVVVGKGKRFAGGAPAALGQAFRRGE